MVDRDKVLAILNKRFAGAATRDLAAAANAIVGLSDEWDEVALDDQDMGYHFSVQCSDICVLADEVRRGAAFKVFRKRETSH